MRRTAATLVLALTLAVAGCSSGGHASAVATATPPATARAAPATPRSVPTTAPDWLWPVAGDIVTPFGPTHPLGIDIAAPIGTEVHAARAGRVVFDGGDACCDTGTHVIVDHGDGYVTVYGRLAAVNVQLGQLVAAGDVIGASGDSGDEGAAAPHLHFEIRRDDVYQNPALFLPGALRAVSSGTPAR